MPRNIGGIAAGSAIELGIFIADWRRKNMTKNKTIVPHTMCFIIFML